MLRPHSNNSNNGQDRNNLNNKNNNSPNNYPITTQENRKSQSRRSFEYPTSESNKRRKSSIINKNILESKSTHRYLPADYINCDKFELITIISRMLTSIVSINDSRTSLDVKYLNNSNLTRFHSRSPPQISIYTYLVRLCHYSSLENCVLIATVYYIDLLTIKYPSFALNSLTVHRFLLTATTIASKALCDSFCSNNHYAKVGGVNIIELNLLEVEFLKWVNYRVIPRDFNYDSLFDRRNSNSLMDDYYSKVIRFGISNAEKILSLYYEKMIGLVGGLDPSRPIIKVGHNDDQIYRLETIQSNNAEGKINIDNQNCNDNDAKEHTYSSSSSDTSSASSTDCEFDEMGNEKSNEEEEIEIDYEDSTGTPTILHNNQSNSNSNPNCKQLNMSNSTLSSSSNTTNTTTFNMNIVTGQTNNTSPSFISSPRITTYSPV